MVKPTLPVDLYVRVSSVGGRGGDSYRSPTEQEAAGRAEAQRRGVAVGQVITDENQSGGKLDRPGLQLALERIRNGESGGLIVYALDRLTREVANGERLLQDIEDAGGAVYAPDLPDDLKSPSGELQLGVTLLMNRYTRSVARARFDSAKRGAIERGIPVAVRVPVGYRQRGEKDRRLEPDPNTAPIVRAAFDAAAGGGRGPSSIARDLDAAGLPTANGARAWSRQAAAAMLANRVYLGEVAWGPYSNDAAHEPLVDLATWHAAQQAPTAPRPPRSDHVYLLTGLARCQSCGNRLSVNTNAAGVRSYKCQTAGCRTSLSVKADWLDAAVVEHYLMPLDEGQTIKTAPTVDLEPLEAALAAAERRFAQVTAPESIDALGATFAATAARYRAERDAAAQALGEAKARAAAAGEVVPPEQARADWHELAPERRRAALRSWYQHVECWRVTGGVAVRLIDRYDDEHLIAVGRTRAAADALEPGDLS